MPRLFDAFPRPIRTQFGDAPCFLIDNVADYFFASERYVDHFSARSWQFTDFPTLAPPFHQYWMEFRIPPAQGRGTHGVHVLEQRPPVWHQHWVETGTPEARKRIEDVLLQQMEALRTEHAAYHAASRAHLAFLSCARLYSTILLDRAQGRLVPGESQLVLWALAQWMDNVRWLLVLTAWIGDDQARLLGARSLCFLALDAQGALLRDAGINQPYSLTWSAATGSQMDFYQTHGGKAGEYGDWQLIHWFFPALFATSLLHCRNVRSTDVTPNKKASAQQRRIKGYPLVTYKVLDIQPMKEVLVREGQSESLGLRRALHSCRGHFANYAEGRGLFGKYHGQYWIPEHVRGTASEGRVVKDYAVKAPQSAPQEPGPPYNLTLRKCRSSDERERPVQG
jgi:hypothetical protein